LIEDLLDVSRIITGNLRLDVRPVELVPVVRAAMDAVRPAADARGIRLETSFDPLAGMVSGDPARLQQVVWNLLSNAVRFTSRGGQVKVSLQSVDAQAEITVSDTGQGINPEFLPYVFDRFRQADSSMTRSHGGLGLGLAIVRHLVELHGGTVEAESEGQGRGASFRISLPLMPAPPATAQTAPAETGEPSRMRQLASLEGLRVLIVDDEPDARDLIKTVLETCGAAVTAVASASEALAALEQFRPDVLISDIGLPGTDGYALIKQVRALKAEQGGGVPAAALSAYVGEENRRMALDAGFQLYVAKPVDPAELVAVVERLSKDGKG
jgi:CheY-like chemotaxis protein